MDQLVLALMRDGPRYVSEYMVLFREALSNQFDVDYPGSTENVYLLSNLYVGTLNKRYVVFYVGVGNTRDTITRVTRVDYTLPLSPLAAKAFGIDTALPVPHEGPDFTNISLEGRTSQIAVASDIAILVAAANPRNRIAPWDAEIVRVQGVFNDAGVGSEMRKTSGKLLQFWRDMYEKVDIEIARIYILAPNTRTPRARALRIRARTLRSAAARATNVPLGAVVASSDRRRRTSTPMLMTQSSTPRLRHTRRLPRDPVTGKIIRMRQPYSDPRSSSTNRPMPSPAAAAGPRAPFARILNRNIIWNNRGIVHHLSESESEGSESEEIMEYLPGRRSNSNSSNSNSNSNSSSELQNLF